MQYRDAGGGGYLSDEDTSGSEDSGRRGQKARRDTSRDRHRYDPSDSEGYQTESGEDRRRLSRHRRVSPGGDDRRPVVIRLLNDLFTKAFNYKTYGLEGRSARDDPTGARHCF